MSSRRGHIEPSACVCMMWLFKRIVSSISLNIMVVKSSLFSCSVVVVDVVVVVIIM